MTGPSVGRSSLVRTGLIVDSMASSEPRVILDTSALLDIFGRWTGDYRERRGDLVREVHVLALLRRYLFSTLSIRDEARRQLVIGADLDRYVGFESVSGEELQGCRGFVSARAADFSLVVLAMRFASQGHRTFLIAKDRTFLRDLAGVRSRTELVVPTGLAEAVMVLTAVESPNWSLSSRILNNTYENLSNSLRLFRKIHGNPEYRDWLEFLNTRIAAKHELIEALKATGTRL